MSKTRILPLQVLCVVWHVFIIHDYLILKVKSDTRTCYTHFCIIFLWTETFLRRRLQANQLFFVLTFNNLLTATWNCQDSSDFWNEASKACGDMRITGYIMTKVTASISRKHETRQSTIRWTNEKTKKQTGCYMHAVIDQTHRLCTVSGTWTQHWQWRSVGQSSEYSCGNCLCCCPCRNQWDRWRRYHCPASGTPGHSILGNKGKPHALSIKLKDRTWTFPSLQIPGPCERSLNTASF